MLFFLSQKGSFLFSDDSPKDFVISAEQFTDLFDRYTQAPQQ